MFTTIIINQKEYKAKLSAEACVELEEILGTNPLNIFLSESGLPSLKSLLTVFHMALKTYNEEITFKDACKLYDEWLEDKEHKHNFNKFVQLITQLFKDAGFIGEETEKNA